MKPRLRVDRSRMQSTCAEQAPHDHPLDAEADEQQEQEHDLRDEEANEFPPASDARQRERLTMLRP